MTAGNVGQAPVLKPILTGLTRDYRNEGFIGEQIFIPVPDTEDQFLVPIFERDQKAIQNTNRSIYGETNVMTPDRADMVEGRLKPHDIAWPIDKIEQQAVRNNPALNLAIEKRANSKVTENILLVQEKEHAELAQADSSFATGHTIVNSGTSLWSDEASTPIEDIEVGKEVISADTALEPNLLVLAENVFRVLKRHPQLIAALSDNRTKIIRIDDMKELFGVKEIIVGKAIEIDPISNQPQKLWKNNAILFYIDRKVKPKSPYDINMSFGFTFRGNRYPYTDQFMSIDGNQTFIRSNDYRLSMVLGATCGYKIKALDE